MAGPEGGVPGIEPPRLRVSLGEGSPPEGPGSRPPADILPVTSGAPSGSYVTGLIPGIPLRGRQLSGLLLVGRSGVDGLP